MHCAVLAGREQSDQHKIHKGGLIMMEVEEKKEVIVAEERVLEKVGDLSFPNTPPYLPCLR